MHSVEASTGGGFSPLAALAMGGGLTGGAALCIAYHCGFYFMVWVPACWQIPAAAIAACVAEVKIKKYDPRENQEQDLPWVCVLEIHHHDQIRELPLKVVGSEAGPLPKASSARARDMVERIEEIRG